MLEVHEGAESAAAVGAAIRIEPLAGELEVRAGLGDGTWRREPKTGARWSSRHAFELIYDAESGRLAWSDSRGELLLEEKIFSEGVNVLRVEVLNLETRAAARLENLELHIDEESLPVRPFARGAMTLDLATIWEPELGRGFRLTGVLAVDDPSSSPSRRVSVEFGLGRGRRIEVAVEGAGIVRSSPERLVQDPSSRSSIAFFGVDETVALEAVETGEARFSGWRCGESKSTTPRIDIDSAAPERYCTAEFTPWAEAQPPAGGQAVAGLAAGGGGFYFFDNDDTLTIPATGTFGIATPYPSVIVVQGPIGGAILDVNVLLTFVSHTFPDDLDVLVVAPDGTALEIMSDVCGGEDIAFQSWRFDDQAPGPLPNAGPEGCTTIAGNLSVQVSCFEGGDTFPAPAPGAYTSSSLSVFDGKNPNGQWRLYVVDDASGDVGRIGSGWSLEITTREASLLIPAAGSFGAASPYPATESIPYSPWHFGTVQDADVLIFGLHHQHPDDLDLLVVAPSGKAVVLASDVCGSTYLQGAIWVFDDEAPGGAPDHTASACQHMVVVPSSYPPLDTWPAPAPTLFGLSLAHFDGDSAEGEWKLFAYDDVPGEVGFISNWSPILRLNGIFRDGFESGSVGTWYEVIP